MKNIKLNSFDFKILSIVHDLNKLDKYPNNHGVYKIISGVEDNETKPYENLIGFSTQISCNSKKISFKTKRLCKYGFLAYIYDETTDKLYLQMTPKGTMEITQYLMKHPHGFKVTKTNPEINIATIKK